MQEPVERVVGIRRRSARTGAGRTQHVPVTPQVAGATMDLFIFARCPRGLTRQDRRGVASTSCSLARGLRSSNAWSAIDHPLASPCGRTPATLSGRHSGHLAQKDGFARPPQSAAARSCVCSRHFLPVGVRQPPAVLVALTAPNREMATHDDLVGAAWDRAARRARACHR